MRELAAEDGCATGSGSPVQFLPAEAPLLEEALRESVERDVDGNRPASSLPDIWRQLRSRPDAPKDKARLLQLVEAGALDSSRDMDSPAPYRTKPE